MRGSELGLQPSGWPSGPAFRPATFHVYLRLVWVRLMLEPALTRHRPGRQGRGGVALLQRTEDVDVARVHRRWLRLPLEAFLAALLQGVRPVFIAPHDSIPDEGVPGRGLADRAPRKRSPVSTPYTRTSSPVKVDLLVRVRLALRCRLSLAPESAERQSG